jgi:Cof subfamily protein (haloacid dehalogenase superfamily)
VTPLLVASDADGTLLDNTNQVSPRTGAVIARVVASGVAFVLVSGRPVRTLIKIARRAGVAGLAICSNGAVVYDMHRDRALRVTTLPPQRIDAIMATFDAHLSGCSFAAESIGAGAALRAETDFRAARPLVKSVLADRSELLARPAVKVVVSHPATSSAALAAAAAALLGNTAGVTFSQHGGLVELSPPNVDKGSGLAWAARHLGVDAAATVAFGDMPNDVPMLRWAGHGVAVANAHPDVIAAADEVTASNVDDGVAQVLERWF